MATSLKVKPVITDHEIEILVLMRQEYEACKKQLEQIKGELDECEQRIIRNIDLGVRVQCRLYDIRVRETERRFPAWKEHYIALAGKDAADRVLANTEAKLYRTLAIKPS